MNRYSQAIAKHARARQKTAIARADASASAADYAILTVWRHLLRLLDHLDARPIFARSDPFEAQARAQRRFEPMALAVAMALKAHLRSMAWWSWKTAQQGIRRAIPPSQLIAQRRLMMYENDSRGDLLSLLFPAPTEDEIVGLMGRGWLDQLSHATRLARPEMLASIVGAGYAAGKTQQQIAKDLLPAVNGFRVSARRVARTEGLRIAHRAQMTCHEQLGDLVAGYTIHATLDTRTRPAHAARDGLTWYKNSGLPMVKALHMEGPTLPDGYNCLLPGNFVSGRVQGASKVYYAGQAVELRCRRGGTVRVTRNHPILTPQGFVPAYRLAKGQQVLCYEGRVDILADHERHAPVPIEKAFYSIKQLPGSVAFRPKTLDFHGDEVLIQGNVDVVTVQRPLSFNGDPENSERVDDPLFSPRRVGTSLVARQRPGALAFDRIDATPTSGIRSEGLLAALFGADVRPFGLFRLGPAAQLNASLYQNSHQTGRAIDAKLPEIATGDTQFAGKLLERFPSLVAADDIVEVRDFEFAGHVYDLQTDVGYYSANCAMAVNTGILVHNCRCWLSPILRAT